MIDTHQLAEMFAGAKAETAGPTDYSQDFVAAIVADGKRIQLVIAPSGKCVVFIEGIDGRSYCMGGDLCGLMLGNSLSESNANVMH